MTRAPALWRTAAVALAALLALSACGIPLVPFI